MQRYLLDTNIVIYLVNGILATELPEGQYCISIISEIELLSFSGLSVAEEQKIRALLGIVESVQVTNLVRDETIKIRRNSKLKLPDAIIAASALSENAILLTNDQAFSGIDKLTIKSLQLDGKTR